MAKFLGEKAKDIKIVSNNGTVDGRNWKIEYRDDSEYGNDKSRSKCQWKDGGDGCCCQGKCELRACIVH